MGYAEPHVLGQGEPEGFVGQLWGSGAGRRGGAASFRRQQHFKVAPPRLPNDIVLRERLLNEMVANDQPLTVLAAPAGFGKTTAMRQLYDLLEANNGAVIWLALDVRDNDLARLVRYLRQVLSRVPSLGLLSAVAGKRTPADFIGEEEQLLDVISSSSAAFTLFLDDFDCLESPKAVRFIHDLILVLGPGQRVVIGSCILRSLPLFSLNIWERQTTIGADALCFDIAETAEFARLQCGLDLAMSNLEKLHAKTVGWPAGVRLALMMRPPAQPLAMWLDGLSGRNTVFTSYFAERVLAILPQQIRRFLISIGTFHHISAPMCDYVLGRVGSSRILDEVVWRNLFVSQASPGSEWFVVHPLFRDFLIEELRCIAPAMLTCFRRRAAEWCLRLGMLDDAVDYALAAEDWVMAAEIMDKGALALIRKGLVQKVSDWIGRLPPSEVSSRINLQKARAYAMTSLYRFVEAREAMMHTAEGDPEAHIQAAMLCEWADRHDLAELEIAKVSAGLSDNDGLKFSACQILRGNLALMRGNFEAARQYLASAKAGHLRGHQGPLASAFTLCFEGALEMMLGHDQDGIERFQNALRQGQGVGAAMAASYLADALYERNDLAGAATLANKYLYQIRDCAPPDSIILAYRTAARIAFLDGDVIRSEDLLAELCDLGDSRKLPRLNKSAWIERSRQALVVGNNRAAQKFIDLLIACGRDECCEYLYPQEIDDFVIAKFRLDLVVGAPEIAVEQIEDALRQARISGRERRCLRLKVLLAQALAAMGRGGAALRLLEEILLAASRNGMVRIFADEPWHLSELLDEFARGNRFVNETYLERLMSLTVTRVAHAEKKVVVSLIEALTAKEMQVIKFVSDGMSNKGVANILNITDNTVETHLKNINQKLGTRKRTEAVARLREAGVLS